MYRLLYTICLATVLLSVYSQSSVLNAGLPVQPGSDTDLVATTESYSAGDCLVTQPIEDEPSKDPNADRFSFGFWYVNADRTIWVHSQDWLARTGHKVIWIRPHGTKLEVSGRRLDAKSPPLRVDIPCCYPTGFQVTGMRFPAEGCWEVIAKAGESELRFVTKVAPARHRSTHNK